VAEAAGRGKLVLAGLWTESCLAMSALSALSAGYEVYIITDASGGGSKESHEMAVQRMTAAGATPSPRVRISKSSSETGRATQRPPRSCDLEQHGGAYGEGLRWEWDAPFPEGLAMKSVELRNELIGTWKLVSYVETSVDGSLSAFHWRKAPRNPHLCAGRLYVGAVDASAKTQLCFRRQVQRTAQEYAEEAIGYLAYSGPFQVDEATGTLTHSMSVSLFPDGSDRPSRGW